MTIVDSNIRPIYHLESIIYDQNLNIFPKKCLSLSKCGMTCTTFSVVEISTTLYFLV
jgi:hypothetical protein